MLTHLTIKQFAIIEHADIELKPGFTIFSGETGAGKSILIDALMFVLGQKGDIKNIRHGQKRAEISLTILQTPSVKKFLTNIKIYQENKIIIRRFIETNSRTRAFINDTPISVEHLKKLGESLVSIHGQHAHILLSDQKVRRDLFDKYAGLKADLEETQKAWKKYQEKKNEYEDFQKNNKNIRERKELLIWKINQLEQLELSTYQWEMLRNEHLRLENIFGLVNGVNDILDTLEQDEKGLIKKFKKTSNQIAKLSELDHTLLAVKDLFLEVQIRLQEATRILSHYAQKIEVNPLSLKNIEEKIDQWMKISQRLDIKPEKIHESLKNYQHELNEYEAKQENNLLEHEVLSAKKNYQAIANKLTQERQQSAKDLEQKMDTLLHSLSMNTSNFKVLLSPIKTGSPNGNEEIHFHIANNEGQESNDFIKISSGGELSRIALALAVATQSTTNIPTLIFDEVDAGIGGRVAEIVGILLKSLGEKRQLLCITHLPQVASKSHSHFYIFKHTDQNGKTISKLKELRENKEKISEIARMSTGIKITKAALEHAKEMLLASTEA